MRIPLFECYLFTFVFLYFKIKENTLPLIQVNDNRKYYTDKDTSPWDILFEQCRNIYRCFSVMCELTYKNIKIIKPKNIKRMY